MGEGLMDIWKIGIVAAPLGDLFRAGRIDQPISWVEGQGAYRFLADPFGLERNGAFFVFAEAYDYRTRLGAIDVLRFDPDRTLRERRRCLTEPWHLSYPVVFEDEGETWMLPEASRSGRLTLYRATRFPDAWEGVAILDLPHVAIDATPFRHEGRWWLLYAAEGALHLAFADVLTGPWHAHPDSPLTRDPRGARPGGTPVRVDGRLCAPVQDCSRTYGGAIRPLWFDALTPERAVTRLGDPILAPVSAGTFRDGLHSMSACGPVTLIDVKRIERSLLRLPVDLLGRSRRAARGWRARAPRTPAR
ncbi:glucosamine inositolphosphorylceramide transferase family protein [Sphingomonas astaxanthinifaciens]|uniref:Glucosamine inositolphosphorylceramide transferase 1 N-terminal domain-containing protein n=1 Tax=Sphingomonas astaxanthinifaciens DSM 22298 TaxID=1123267 RepID=A0ABQ5Z8N3_9SPHN|nr:hypothetical protein [Sphingomonas astaxanthinifaciens]GLR47836.1 hypothetical protein GCM10007925_15490 [Sphingomonas astaxanthinifaciens DSM 22298]